MRIIADNLQITNPDIHRAVEENDPEPVRRLVRQCMAAGADAVDINSGPLSRNPADRMRFLVEAVRSETSAPILLDTTNPRAIEAGLQASRKKTIINGVSLEPAKLDAILPLAEKYEADIIGYLLRPNGHVPADEAERMNIALALYEKYQRAGLDDSRLVIDPIIAPLLWENGTRQNREILSLLRNLPDLLGFPVRTIAGISNLTSGSRAPLSKKIAVEQAYIAMLAAAGLDMALLNVFHADAAAAAKASALLLDDRIFTWEML